MKRKHLPFITERSWAGESLLFSTYIPCRRCAKRPYNDPGNAINRGGNHGQ